MSEFKYKIIPYSESYEEALLELEKNSPQGKFIQMEMIRDCFKTRSTMFEKYQIYLAVDHKERLLGVLAAAIVPFAINGKKSNAGYCFDVRVAKHARGHGLTKKMGKYAYDHFYVPNGAPNVFLTLKKDNKAVLKSAKIVGLKLYNYSFSYLTIPTYKRLNTESFQGPAEKLIITAPNNSKKLSTYLYEIAGELKIWRADLIYRLKIRKLHVSIKYLNQLLSFIRRGHSNLPNEGEELRFAMLVYRNKPSSEEINSILSYLQQHKIGYLLVACTQNSRLLTFLKPLAINCYSYMICSTFPISQNDCIELDVRCL